MFTTSFLFVFGTMLHKLLNFEHFFQWKLDQIKMKKIVKSKCIPSTIGKILND
jgi:hypothetical protein